MNETEIKTISDEIKHALKAVAEKHNMNIDLGGITYSNIEFHTKLTVKLRELNGKSVDQIEFERYCMIFGFKPEDYLRIANKPGQGHLFRIVGFKPNSPKFSLLVEDVDTGARYGLAENARKLWGVEAPGYNLTLTSPPSRAEKR